MESDLKTLFGVDAKVESVDVLPGLPLYLTKGRTFSKVTLAGVSFLLVGISESDKYSVVALEKQLGRYIETVKMNTGFCFPTMTKHQRNALTGKMIPFIALPGQIFLPFLGISLTEQFQKKKKSVINRFTPAAQMLFLYFLYQIKSEPLLKKDAAIALGLTKTSITRASEELLSAELIKEEACGREIKMFAVDTGQAFYEKGKAFLINPVLKDMTAVFTEKLKKYPVAGETALSMRTMLNGPKIPVIAVNKKDSVLKEISEVNEKWSINEKLIRIEIWKYDPKIFICDNLIDPVSMALSLKDCCDERVQGELEEYWRISRKDSE